MELLALENLKFVSEQDTQENEEDGEITPWQSPVTKWQTIKKSPPRKFRTFDLTQFKHSPNTTHQAYTTYRSPALIRINHPFSFSEHKDETMRKLYERLQSYQREKYEVRNKVFVKKPMPRFQNTQARLWVRQPLQALPVQKNQSFLTTTKLELRLNTSLQ